MLSTKAIPTESGNEQRKELAESEAIRKAQRGDASAFEHLYNRHKRRVHALCLRIVSDPTEAEDLTQEAFLLVFRKIHTFRGASAFSTWLHRLAVNVAYMHLRRRRLPSTSLNEPANSSERNQGHTAEVGGPDVMLEGFIDRVHLERALAALTDASKTVFVLHDVHGFKHREIAKIMRCSVESSKGQLHRARVRLRHLLRQRLSEAHRVFESVGAQQMTASAGCSA